MNTEIGTAFIRGNTGSQHEVLTGLKVGDKLLCIKTQESESGIGLWSTTRYDSFEKGKIYEVDHITNWNGTMVAYVTDEDATSTWAKPETFQVIRHLP